MKAVVSRGGRPDLAGSALAAVRAPTLLIVGTKDYLVIELNREALAHLHCDKQLSLVPGATHLFPEPGKLERAGRPGARLVLALSQRRRSPYRQLIAERRSHESESAVRLFFSTVSTLNPGQYFEGAC